MDGVDKINNIIWAFFYIVICALILFKSDVFATPSVFEAMEKVETAEKAAPADEFIKKRSVIYKAESLRDPFQTCMEEENKQSTSPQTSSVPQNIPVANLFPSLTVQGIVWGGNFPQAIINNKVVKVGEAIEGANVKAIDKEGVTFIFEGIERKLSTSVSAPVSTSGPNNKNIF